MVRHYLHAFKAEVHVCLMAGMLLTWLLLPEHGQLPDA